MTNAVIFQRSETSIIEVRAAHINIDFESNLKSVVAKYITSEDHTPANPKLVSIRNECSIHKSKCQFSKRMSLKQEDLIVNITILRNHLEESIQAVCNLGKRRQV